MRGGSIQSFGEQLRSFRRAAGLSQEALAERAGLSVDAIAALERGRRLAPRADTVGRLARALHLATDERARFLRAVESPSPVPSGATPISHNLPIAVSSFVGRTEAISALRRLLSAPRPGAPLLTLAGAGGIGKTRLALEVARSLVDESPAALDRLDGVFVDGVWLADLSALDDASVLPAAVAASLGARDTPTPWTVAALTRVVGERRLLIVLDNCEHLIDDCARLVDAVLRSCPYVRILATSREALAIPGEVVWPVSALSLVEAGIKQPEPDRVLGSEAGRLFVERASAVRPDFRLDEHNAGAVAELCRQLDGIPLAIELASARVNAFDVPAILARLADRFVLLRSGNRGAMPRHQTLQALVQWSYDLLSPEERCLFARLTVFAGGWDVEAVETIAAGDEASRASTVELLARLVDKSLVVRSAALAGRTRYRLLETLRQFGAQRLETSGEVPRLRELHARYYMAEVARMEPYIDGPSQAEYLQRLEEDIDNVRLALDWCVQVDDVAPALGASWTLALLAGPRGHLEEMEGRLATLLALPSAAGVPAHLRAKALLAAAWIVFCRGELERAHALGGQGLREFRRLGLTGETAQALVWFGLIVSAESDWERARSCFVDALAIFRERDDEFWTARAATNLGRCLVRLGEFPSAIPLLEEALGLRRRVGDRRGVANTLHHLSDALEATGDLLQARALAQEALSIAQVIEDRFVTQRALIGLGRLAFLLGDLEAAEIYLSQAIVLARQADFGHEVAEIAVLLGFVARDLGHVTQARALADEALTCAQRQAHRPEAARALCLSGTLARQDGQLALARACFRASLSIYQQLPDLRGVGVALALASLASVLEAEAQAARLAGAAEVILQNSGPGTSTIELRELRQTLAELRTLPNKPTDGTAWASGRAALLDDVVAEARTVESE